MSKQWYYQVMGSEVGPLSPPELKQKVLQGVIQPDTLIRVGPDGKWLAADHVRGLLDLPATPPPTTPAAAQPRPAAPPSQPGASSTKLNAASTASASSESSTKLKSASPAAPSPSASSTKLNAAAPTTTSPSASSTKLKPTGAPSPAPTATTGQKPPPPAAAPPTPAPAPAPVQETMPLDDMPHEFDFFQFVGFENAIGSPLFQVLSAHCRVHHQTLGQATQTALAHFLNRKDLLPTSDPSKPAPAAPIPAPSP